jgi:adenine-specific DNA-methyltransferase
MTYEQQFLDALKSIFIGAKVEGDSGYINLMKIKANYFEKGVFPVLMKDIDAVCKPFGKGFREELFDKLYDFFRHYFSESGSIYFRNTAQHHNIYEKVYTDDRDVMLFWKTHMLYYVKTDRLFNSMEIEIDGEKFFFDVSGMELKRSNEKRELTYAFKSFKDGKIALTVGYSEKGRKTKIDEIVKAVKDKGMTLDEETLEKAFAVFQKQSEVDYFINKNAQGFLQEQFDLWMYQYVFKGESEFTELRLKQLQAIKTIAYKIIDFIAQFEDELVRVWNKPKFVLNSHYIITLDKILGAKTSEVWKKLFKHKGMKDQLTEWVDLGMIDDKTFRVSKDPKGLLALILEKDLVGDPLYPQFQFLPLDTKHFPDLELDILALFDDLDSALDGWLIHSENYQALNTLLPKFNQRVEAIYIDPPYNTDASAIIYSNNYKDSSWITLMENRLNLARDYLTADGIICVAIDDEEAIVSRFLLSSIFSKQVGIAAVRSNPAGRKTKGKFAPAHEYALFFGKSESSIPNALSKSENSLARYPKEDENGRFAWANFIRSGSNDRREDRPKLYYPIFVNRNDEIRIPKMEWRESRREYELLEKPKEGEKAVYPIMYKDGVPTEKNWQRGHLRVSSELKSGEFRVRRNESGEISVDFKTRMDEGSLPITWWDDKRYASANYGAAELKALFLENEFDFPKAKQLVSDCIKASGMKENHSIVLDFFAGSGTTANAVIDLNREDEGKRKYICVELGKHYNTVVLPRVKKVVFSDKWKDGKAQEGQGISHFAKYFELEQYEDALKRARYEDVDTPLFIGADAYNSYVFLRDLKMLEAVQVDRKQNKVEVNLETLYDGIDLAETLSCLTGKWIKRITKETVEFEDGTTASLSEPQWEEVKPLVWW